MFSLFYTLNCFDIYYLAGFTTLLLLFWSILLSWCYRLTVVLNYFVYIYNTAFLAGSIILFSIYYTVLPPSTLCPFPLCGIKAILFWPVIVLLCSLLTVCIYLKFWYSLVVFPSYRRWCHPSRKVNSQNRTVRPIWAREDV